ncbi:hypothetical protein LWI28_027500 [Acer negundo]|uniref:Uncharacterized protein n=1 Tax=Acer negundo TaxID=4023 RepID=A0AAD5NYH5_ACENE|nr:hypothetical protein LWI28_027500 [Acer negundo]
MIISRVDYDRKLMVHISASTEVHEKGRNVAKKGMTTNTSMIDASKFSENLVSMESARIKGCMKDNNIIKDLRGEIEITEPQKTTDFNVDIMAIYAINVTKSFEGEFPAAADKGKQVEATECNLISQSHSNIRTGFRLGHQEVSSAAIPASWRVISSLEHQLNCALDTKEWYWRQRARIEWLRNGERKTQFFHSKASAKRSYNIIVGLFNKGGEWVEKKEEMEDVISQYF